MTRPTTTTKRRRLARDCADRETCAAVNELRLERDATVRQYVERDRSFAALAETAVSPVISTTADGIITTWNPAAERLYGYTATEALSAHIGIIIPPDRHEEFRAAVDQLRNGGSGDAFETVRIAKDGRRTNVLLILSAIRSPNGELAGIIKVTRDITDRKLAEEKFRLAVEACPDGMIMSDAAGRIVMVNGEIERLFGYRREELIGQPIETLMPARMRTQHAHYRVGFSREGKATRHRAGRELTGLRKDGREFPVEVGLNPIHTHDGVMVLSAVVDISERKRLDRLKDEFVAVVSHELRTPLTSIAGSLGLLVGNSAGSLPDAAKRLLTIAQSNSNRLVRLINDILDLQKIESGGIVFRLQRLDLRTLIEQMIEANRVFAHGFGVRLRLEARSANGAVLADADRLAQVVTNLLSNAIKFSPTGDEVVIAIARRGPVMRVTVRDHGSGIPEEFKPRIFERFAQADSSDARQKGGTGLGLSIARQLIQRHGGSIGFEAAPGGGTIFFFELPSFACAPAGEPCALVDAAAPPMLPDCDAVAEAPPAHRRTEVA
ncbi:MAG TPA: PAS domain S-box protein [Xanthobacteraceae bacterium]|nr:PAS domain S-box protein [Xanthobacteraceae bacterium]